ncbi:hypothetical protein N7532_006588 [Penicillium argentinense]|uniref:Spindle pole body associated protein SnaD n=1 Tax=Penicillium argentinense TaxID=1131581 RepID=A0A9W9KC39_9EURO|nr:uncharacterized protein N7532_006588 [Penicillium argentinense]KAJ5099587.1 hypothetical protein N7532_006588 [Penicillium argentinense]
MANAAYTSPFPTSHDTIGQSTLATPLFMRSSPPQHPESPPDSPLPEDSPIYPDEPADREFASEDEDDRGQDFPNDRHNEGPPSPSPSDLDARLANYTLDFSQFPSGQFSDARDGAPLPELKDDEEDKLSDVGGPEDFTANIEKYLMGEGMSSIKKTRKIERREVSGSALQHSSVRSKQPAVEEDGDSADYSEFGPPVDMSTPSHVLNRTSGLARDSNLEDIEEDPADGLPSPASPSNRSLSMEAEDEDRQDAQEEEMQRLLHRIEYLEEDVRDRDDQLERNRKRVLEAASAGEQIKHLQMEIQRKNDYVEELEARENGEEILREQLESLQKQSEERQKLLDQSQTKAESVNALEQQVRDLQHQLQNRGLQDSLEAERLETIAHLREQLNLSQDQLKQRDQSLAEALEKLREATRANEIQLSEKNTEIDGLKAEMSEQALKNERLDWELDRVNTEYQALEDRLTAMETQNQPLEDLEEKNLSLEADLSRVQSQVEAQENALKAVAADLPGGSNAGGHTTYSEILDLIKDLGHSNVDLGPESPAKDHFPYENDLIDVKNEISRLQQEAQDATAAQKAADAEVSRLREQAAESQSFFKTIETENSRLSKRVEELSATLNKTQHELNRTQEEHAESLEIVARLQEESLGQPPSPPPSPPMTRGAQDEQGYVDTAALEESHQAQIRSIQTAHSTAVSTLRSSHAESMRKIRNLLEAAERRESDLRTELTNMRSEVKTRESKLRKSFKTEMKRLEAVISAKDEIIAAKDETAAELDKRIALSVDKREQEWERRVDLLLKDRDRMAKALMQTWGEQEMGPGPGPLAGETGESTGARQGQAYRYKNAKKDKSKNSERKT